MPVLSASVQGLEHHKLASLFKALADPARLKILQHLAEHSKDACCSVEEAVCACDFEAITGLSQPTVSHHMKLLMAAQLVDGQKHGKWMFYQVNSAGLEKAREALKHLGG